MRRVALAGVFALLAGAALAQTAYRIPSQPQASVPTFEIDPATGLPVASSAPSSAGTPTQSTVSCGTSSTTLLAAGSANSFIRISVPTGGAAVWFNWAGAAATQAPPSDQIAAGGAIIWSRSTGYLPTGVLTCIASAATSVTLVYK